MERQEVFIPTLGIHTRLALIGLYACACLNVPWQKGSLPAGCSDDVDCAAAYSGVHFIHFIHCDPACENGKFTGQEDRQAGRHAGDRKRHQETHTFPDMRGYEPSGPYEISIRD